MTALLPPLEHVHNGCMNCPPKPIKINLNWNIHPGFGCVLLTRDGEVVWSDSRMERQRHGAGAEAVARKDPDHDWRLIVDGPLSGVEYQRHGRSEWVAVASNRGFA